MVELRLSQYPSQDDVLLFSQLNVNCIVLKGDLMVELGHLVTCKMLNDGAIPCAFLIQHCLLQIIDHKQI